MNQEDFNDLVDARFFVCRTSLGQKSNEYSRNGDKLHNFKRAGAMLSCTPEEALLGMVAKHQISIMDIVDDIADGLLPTDEKLSEKMTDSINYLLLLEGLIRERLPQ
jgi:hypothetical protein